MRIAILLAVMLEMSGPASAVVGDLNLDGVVDLKDFFLLADSFGDTGPPEVDDCSGGAVTLSTAAITETRERTLVPCAWFKPTAFRRYALARSRAEVPLSLIGDSDGGRLDGGVSEWQPYAA